MQRRTVVDGRGAALDVVHISTFVDDDQRPLELAHVLGVDAEVRLQRDVDVHTLGHVDKRAAGPYGRVQRGELVVTGRDDRAEILPEKVFLLAQTGVRVEEQNALTFEVFTNLVVNNFAL